MQYRLDMLHKLAARDAACLIARGEITCVQLAEAYLNRIDIREPITGAWAYLDADSVLAQARSRDQEPPRSPLHGIPVGFKDIIDTFDMPTCHGSPIYEGHRPFADAACVAMTRAAGGVVMGKTVTTEFAFARPGKTANPLNPAHTPGGSSSGSAAAVADYMVPIAFGTQSGGSVIRPASFCGVVGYKSSVGALPTKGVKPYSSFVDTLGIFARCVSDIVLMRSILTGSESTCREPAVTPRIALYRTTYWDELEPAMREAVDLAGKSLMDAGAVVEEIDLPEAFGNQLMQSHLDLTCYEAARSMRYEHDVHKEQMHSTYREMMDRGIQIPYSRYRECLDHSLYCKDYLNTEIFPDYDVILSAAAIGEAHMGLHGTGTSILNGRWTQMQLCAVNLPGYSGANNLPLGMQVIGRHHGDDELLAIAHWMEHRIGQVKKA